MKKYNSFDKSKGKSNYGGKPSYGTKPSHNGAGRSDKRDGKTYGKPEMHPAVCSECKANTEVPFKPAYGKPVSCRDCFGSKGQERGRESGGRGSREYKGGSDQKSFRDNPNSDLQDGFKRLEKQLVGISAKMEQIIAVISDNTQTTK